MNPNTSETNDVTPEIERTQRGFGIYGRMIDSKGTDIRIQQSSSVIPAVWIFGQDKDGKDFPPHLSINQIDQMIAILKEAKEHLEEE